ncbi:Hypothetical predicted protein, partial [Pelobates cultripes]
MRGLMIRRASYLNKQRRATLMKLLIQLRDITQTYYQTKQQDLLPEIQTITTKINEHQFQKPAYILKKFKMNHYAKGNKASKLLANMLRKKQSNAKIPYILSK